MEEKMEYLEIYNKISDKLLCGENGYRTDSESIFNIAEKQTTCKINSFEMPLDNKIIIQKKAKTINIIADSQLSALYERFYFVTAVANILMNRVTEDKIDYSKIEEDVYCLSLLLLMPKEKLDKALNSYNSFNKICSLFGVDSNMLKHRITLDSYLEYIGKQEKIKKKTK